MHLFVVPGNSLSSVQNFHMYTCFQSRYCISVHNYTVHDQLLKIMCQFSILNLKFYVISDVDESDDSDDDDEDDDDDDIDEDIDEDELLEEVRQLQLDNEKAATS